MPTISTLLTLPVSWVTTAKGVGFIILHNGLGKLDACKVNFTFVVDFLYAFMLGIVIQVLMGVGALCKYGGRLVGSWKLLL